MEAAHIVMSEIFILFVCLMHAFLLKAPISECEPKIYYIVLLKWKCNSKFLIFLIYVIVLDYAFIIRHLILELTICLGPRTLLMHLLAKRLVQGFVYW